MAGRDAQLHPRRGLSEARALVLSEGWNAAAYQILNPGLDLWFSRRGDAVAGFRDWGGVRVVAGAPVCAEARLAAASDELEADAAASGLRVCYFGAGRRLEGLLGDRPGWSRAGIGAQPVWDPAAGALADGHASLRAQIHRARNKGVTVREGDPSAAGSDARLRGCLAEWLAGRRMPPMGFLVEPHTLDRLWDRRLFVAERDGRTVGFLVASPVAQRNGWLIEQIVRGREAPNGTAEALVEAAYRAASAAGLRYFTLGLAPLTSAYAAPGGGNPLWVDGVFAWARAHGRRFYDFQGLEHFKAKFRPREWEPIFILCRGSFSPRVLMAVAAAFARGRPFRFLAGVLGRALRQELAWAASPAGSREPAAAAE